jgi:hypothetical protein
LLYAEFNRRYPRSRFILTVRDSESWLESFRQHHAAHPDVPFHDWLYGGRSSLEGHEGEFVARYERHNADVRAYFGRKKKLLTFDVFNGDGWDQLCGFLGVPAPTTPFPNEKSTILDLPPPPAPS